MLFKSYIDPVERREADRKLPSLMVEGLLLGGSGLGVLALIFEIAADAFSVAAYQTLLAIHGAEGYHEIAIAAFIVLSVMLFLGIVPAYKAGAYLRPNAGGSGPLVEAIGPPRMRWLSWVGTSLFFLDAVLTIIISSISAADVTMLLLPELANVRILLAEFYAFFIMAVLVALGPQRAVPLFLLGGGAFTIFTLIALSVVGSAAAGNPEWSFLANGIITRLQEQGVVEHVVRAQEDISALSQVTIFQFFFRSMSSAMLGFSGYEVIPASGKHAARPKWKVINTALTLAAVFLIGTGVLQLYAAQQWNIPSTEGYSTLLIEYETIVVQQFNPDGALSEQDAEFLAEALYEANPQMYLNRAERFFEHHSDELLGPRPSSAELEEKALELAYADVVSNAANSPIGQNILTLAGVLLAFILLLAQGGGYVGGAAVASNAARLGRMPRFFLNDRYGIVVIWSAAAIFIPLIREVVVVESYYAFGFVSAFIITSTTVFFVRDDVLEERDIIPGSAEARSLKFAGLRGMIASYIMGIVLVTQKTDALGVIILFGAALTLFQMYIARGGFIVKPEQLAPVPVAAGREPPVYASGQQRAIDEARQRGVADLLNKLVNSGRLVKFNMEPERIQRLVAYTHNVRNQYINCEEHHHGERFPEPSIELEQVYQDAYKRDDELISHIEYYSHYGIFTFIDKYYQNWVNEELGRDKGAVQEAMVAILFPMSSTAHVISEYGDYEWIKMPEEIWQFCRKRYQWAKDQWPNLSDRITTVWTLQELGLIPEDVDVKNIIAVTQRHDVRAVEIHTGGHRRKTNPVEPGEDGEVPAQPDDPDSSDA